MSSPFIPLQASCYPHLRSPHSPSLIGSAAREAEKPAFRGRSGVGGRECGKATSDFRPGGKSHLLRLSLPFLRSKPGEEQENAGRVLCAQLSRVVRCWGGDLGFEPGYRAQQMAPLAWALRKAGQWRPVSFPCGPPGGSCYCHLGRSARTCGSKSSSPQRPRGTWKLLSRQG